ncbi:hypothetical protein EON65_57180, partial [archaeon]
MTSILSICIIIINLYVTIYTSNYICRLESLEVENQMLKNSHGYSMSSSSSPSPLLLSSKPTAVAPSHTPLHPPSQLHTQTTSSPLNIRVRAMLAQRG